MEERRKSLEIIEECVEFLKKNEKVEKKGFLNWTRSIFNTCSVEPVLVLSMMTSMLVQVISQSWLLRIACEELNSNYCFNESCVIQDCDNSSNQAELQKTVAQVQAWRSAVEFSVPLFLVPFLGAWSDAKPGRRLPVLLFALSGRAIQMVLALVLLLLPSSPTLTVAALCLALPVALTASTMAVDMAAYSHISDTSATKIRTVRLGIANAFWCLGAVLGLLCSGLLFQAGGELLVFSVALVLQLAACGVAVWRVRLPSDSTQSEAHSDNESSQGCKLLLEPFTVAIRRRPGKARLLMALMLINLLLAYGASCGRQAVLFLYTRLRFGWDEVEYGLYGTFLMLMEVIGSFIAMSLFSHKLRLPDTVVGLMSCVSQVLSSTFYTFAASTLGMYIAPLVEIANGQVVVIPRAIVTKLTEPHEQASVAVLRCNQAGRKAMKDEISKVHALFGCVEAVVPLIFEPLYNSLYSATLDFMPESVFWLSAALTVPPTILFIWLQWGGGKSWIPDSRVQPQTL